MGRVGPGKIQCNTCGEWMTADLGPNTTPFHIRRGGVTGCPGSKRSPKNYNPPPAAKKKGK